MAASIRSTSSFVATGSVTSGVVPMPSGWQPGDVFYIISALASATGTITAPTGYTELIAQFHSAATTSATMELCRRVLQTGDTAPTVTCKSGRLCCIGVAVMGADTVSGPEDGTAASDTNSGVTFPSVRAPSVSPTGSNSLLLTFHGEYEGTNSFSVSFTPDASETEADDQSTAVSGSSNAGVEVAWQALSASGATGTRTATASTSSTTHGPMGVSVAVLSAAAAVTIPPPAPRRTAARTPALPPERRFRAVLPPPAQDFLFIEGTQRRETWPRGLPRRGRATFVVPPQLNPPYPFAEITQRRQAWPRVLTRRGRQVTPVRAQLNPPYPFTELRQWRQPRGFFPRRGRAAQPVPAQQSAPVGVFVPQAPRRARLAAALRRRQPVAPVPGQHHPPLTRPQPRPRPQPRRHAQAAQPVPAQVTVTPPAWVSPHRAPLRALALIRRRFAQLLPWPQATGPPPFTVGALTAATAPAATLGAADSPESALTAAVAPSGTITATDQRTGGPGG